MDWITTSDDHDIYGIAIMTLDDGRTIEDLNKWNSLDEPPWADVLSFRDAVGKTTTKLFINLDKDEGPFYFVCSIQKRSSVPWVRLGLLNKNRKGPVSR